jgi:TIR domain
MKEGNLPNSWISGQSPSLETQPERLPNFDEGRLPRISTPLEIFCCYAREDRDMLDHLKKHLTPLERQGWINIWSDTNLNAGVEWEKELRRHLEKADIILLLISPDFMASDYCYSTEMDRAIERHNEGSVQAIPILLRPTLWQYAPFAKFQMVPTNATPITSWLNRDAAFLDVAMQVNQVVAELRSLPKV